jgi:hypothetical protein
MRLRFFFVLIYILCVLGSGYSQSTQDGSWSTFVSQIRLHEKWSIHAEGQYRDYGIFDEAEQKLLRTGINYHLSPLTSYTLGYGRVTNFADDDLSKQAAMSTEHRIWEQLALRNNYGRTRVEHRYRLEQRFIGSAGTIDYFDRVRYLLRVTVPINHKELEKNTVFLTAYNEVMLHFKPKPFDRNRLYGAIGYQFTPLVNFQFGYMLQSVNDLTREFYQVGLYYNIDVRKKEESK